MTKEKLIHLAVGKPSDYSWKNGIESSAIGKTAVETAKLTSLGFIGDGVANPEFHGGRDRAVCLYPFEHYDYWNRLFETQLIPPAFGENITAAGMTEKDVCIGDIYRIGNAVLQVTQGRIPCSTISKYNREDRLLKKIFETGFTGYFFRVLEEGTIDSESKIELMEKEQNRVSVFFTNQILYHEQDNKAGVKKILRVDALADVWRKKLIKFL